MENKTKTKTDSNASIMHSFKDSKNTTAKKKLITFLAVIALLGIGTGFVLGKQNSTAGKNVPLSKSDNPSEKGKVFGSDDKETFKDTAEGIVKKGGIEGEGQYHLERPPGGEDQYVYMTSSSVDLSEFINKKIKVWGQTQTAQKAGWLMDVGRVEVL